MSADRDEMDKMHERSKALFTWFMMIRKVAPRETQVDLLRSRFEAAVHADERSELHSLLVGLLQMTGQLDEALQRGDAWIAENPDDMHAYLCKARTYQIWLNDFDNALVYVERAVACARRTGKWVRTALGFKARLLVDMRRGDALAAVLEEIMAVKVTRGVIDMGRERDFVDAAPAWLIPSDLLARYDAFCPKRDGDTPHEIARFDQPDWGPDGEEIPVTRRAGIREERVRLASPRSQRIIVPCGSLRRRSTCSARSMRLAAR